MEHLPPVGWANVATKDDLARLESRFENVDRRFQEVDRRFEEIDRRFDGVNRRFDDLGANMMTKVDGERLRVELYKGLRLNTLVTVGVLTSSV